MNNRCLNIYDDCLVNKLKYFIYEYSDIEYNNFELTLNYIIGNRNDLSSGNDKKNVYDLRRMLSCIPTKTMDIKELEKSIELFLLFLRTYNNEASACLDNLLNAVRNFGEDAKDLTSVNRLTGILAALYLLYYCSEAKPYNTKMTYKFLSEHFDKNIVFLTNEDKNFLSQIFFDEKRIGFLVTILRSYLVMEDKQDEETYTEKSKQVVFKIFTKTLNKFYNAKNYNIALAFFEKGEHLFQLINDVKIKSLMQKEKAKLYFNLRRFEEAKCIQDSLVEAFDSIDVIDLYNRAIYYAWAADYKEKDVEWKNYLNKAYELIVKAEEIVRDSKNISIDRIEDFKNYIIFEKSFVLSEQGKYNEAYGCFEKAFSNANKKTIKDSNFSTHMWILMKYMSIERESDKVIDRVNEFYNNFSSLRLNEYKPIVEFMNSDEYLKNNTLLYKRLYPLLMKILFHALEIIHETKIRNVSKYDVIYYTKIEHLKLLLEDENDQMDKNNVSYRLPLFHTYHMNDPQEGKMLKKLLKFGHEEECSDPSEARREYEENYVFLKSFFCYYKESNNSTAKEFLPMWVQYGNDPLCYDSCRRD